MRQIDKSNEVKTVIVGYAVILAIAGLQVALALRQGTVGEHLTEMLGLGLTQATVAILFFMRPHTKLILAVVLVLVPAFLLFLMNALWVDSYRIVHMRPWAN